MVDPSCSFKMCKQQSGPVRAQFSTTNHQTHISQPNLQTSPPKQQQTSHLNHNITKRSIMTSTIQVRPHPSKHRALHATTVFTPGQIIHTFHPLILHPSLSHLTTVCTYCLRPGSPRACSRCHAAYYCDATCQQAGWTAVHSKECKPLRQRKLGSRTGAELPSPVRTLVQTLLKGEIQEAVGKLDGHAERKRNTKSWPDLEMMAMAACAFAGKDGGEEEMRKAVELLCKVCLFN